MCPTMLRGLRTPSATADTNVDCVLVKKTVFVTITLNCKKQTKKLHYWPNLIRYDTAQVVPGEVEGLTGLESDQVVATKVHDVVVAEVERGQLIEDTETVLGYTCQFVLVEVEGAEVGEQVEVVDGDDGKVGP